MARLFMMHLGAMVVPLAALTMPLAAERAAKEAEEGTQKGKEEVKVKENRPRTHVPTSLLGMQGERIRVKLNFTCRGCKAPYTIDKEMQRPFCYDCGALLPWESLPVRLFEHWQAAYDAGDRVPGATARDDAVSGIRKGGSKAAQPSKGDGKGTAKGKGDNTEEGGHKGHGGGSDNSHIGKGGGYPGAPWTRAAPTGGVPQGNAHMEAMLAKMAAFEDMWGGLESELGNQAGLGTQSIAGLRKFRDECNALRGEVEAAKKESSGEPKGKGKGKAASQKKSRSQAVKEAEHKVNQCWQQEAKATRSWQNACAHIQNLEGQYMAMEHKIKAAKADRDEKAERKEEATGAFDEADDEHRNALAMQCGEDDDDADEDGEA